MEGTDGTSCGDEEETPGGVEEDPIASFLAAVKYTLYIYVVNKLDAPTVFPTQIRPDIFSKPWLFGCLDSMGGSYRIIY